MGSGADGGVDISVIIASYQRREVLLRALALYDRQRDVGGSFEVIVVDDASTDGTAEAVEGFARSSRYPVRVERLASNSGPAAARNRAIDLARGRILVFANDDILPEPGFLGAHRRWHDDVHPELHEAMVGRIRWASEMGQTPFLSWLELKGAQFAYGSMQHGAIVDYGKFYTSNASVKRAFLERTGIRFDEQLPFGRVVGWEDCEFALALAKVGMVLRHDADAAAEHLHPMDLASSLRRAEALGAQLPTLREVSPDNFRRATGGLFEPERRARRVLFEFLASPPFDSLIWTPLARLSERRIRAGRVFAIAHAAAVLRGFRRAQLGSGGGASGGRLAPTG